MLLKYDNAFAPNPDGQHIKHPTAQYADHFLSRKKMPQKTGTISISFGVSTITQSSALPPDTAPYSS